MRHWLVLWSERRTNLLKFSTTLVIDYLVLNRRIFAKFLQRCQKSKRSRETLWSRVIPFSIATVTISKSAQYTVHEIQPEDRGVPNLRFPEIFLKSDSVSLRSSLSSPLYLSLSKIKTGVQSRKSHDCVATQQSPSATSQVPLDPVQSEVRLDGVALARACLQ